VIGQGYSLFVYTFNEYLIIMNRSSFCTFNSQQPGYEFSGEGLVSKPAKTPVFADGVWWIAGPLASDWPAADLYTGWNPAHPGAMSEMTIARHGNQPRPVPRNWPTSAPLPAAVNVVCFDGHAEAVRLDDLWQLYWHAKYEPPAKRPGLE
jgi:hypothetical protein